MRQEIVCLSVHIVNKEVRRRLLTSNRLRSSSPASKALVNRLQDRAVKAVFITPGADDGFVLPGEIDFRSPGVEIVEVSLESGRQFTSIELDRESAVKLAREILDRFSPMS